MVRLWLNGEDIGKMTDGDADMVIQVHKKNHPDEPATKEEVPDDAPNFLPR